MSSTTLLSQSSVATQCDFPSNSEELFVLLDEAERAADHGIMLLTDHTVPKTTAVDHAAQPAAAILVQLDDNPFGPNILNEAALFEEASDGLDRPETPSLLPASEGDDNGRSESVPPLDTRNMKNVSSSCSLGSWAYVYTPRSPTSSHRARGGLGPTSSPHRGGATPTPTSSDGGILPNSHSDSNLPGALPTGMASPMLGSTVTLRPLRPPTPRSVSGGGVSGLQQTTMTLDPVAVRRPQPGELPPPTPLCRVQTPPRHPHSHQQPTHHTTGLDQSTGKHFACALFVDSDATTVQQQQPPLSPPCNHNRGAQTTFSIRETVSRLMTRTSSFSLLRSSAADIASHLGAWGGEQRIVKDLRFVCRHATEVVDVAVRGARSIARHALSPLYQCHAPSLAIDIRVESVSF